MNSNFVITCLRRAVRKANRKYPSERRELKQKLRQKEAELSEDGKNRDDGYWRFFTVPVPVDKDPGKDYIGVSDALMEGIARYIKFPVANILPQEAFSVVRKSFDARKCLKEPRFVYTVDMNVKEALSLQPRLWDFISDLSFKPGKLEYISSPSSSLDLIGLLNDDKCTQSRIASHSSNGTSERSSNKMLIMKDIKQSNVYMVTSEPKVVVVGSGPAGLFASLVLAELGAKVTIVERGQPVEKRGRDIGALVVRRQLKSESNFCFGEGGAGTWSDGKLTTKIGKNSDNVQIVLKTLVHFGAPASILIDGKPHLGTDRLIRILLNFRQHLQDLGVQIMFGTRMDDLLVTREQVIGVQVSDAGGNNQTNTQKLGSDAVILAVGHSARDVYERLLERNVLLMPKDFAVGFRVEHPQDLINKIQYSKFADEVHKGRGKVPVADYKLATYLTEHDVQLPLRGENNSRSCYSFCMCPGGQVVLTSTNPSELCINGMSFSTRSSKWANAAIVVTVSSKDFSAFQSYGHLAGVAFQREFEKEAAVMGGGNFVVPAQTVPNFLESKLSDVSLPPSSYRLGVKAAPLHQLFPSNITHALKQSLISFEKELPGFISKEALLHGVETRTSAPVKIPRDMTSYESLSMRGLYPIGEGAGYAGGIVSAAVDGLCAGFALAKQLNLYKGSLLESILDKSQRDTGNGRY
ncbi:hypothetical protein SUGI_0259820 [Cryptomeria japonica]|nr:hypothetical protein SUGI_0259820 [Cryptomeria japonica]